jgi:cellulose synthase/poly-beta-1,6-N-acetylglucosamine synthase-like glycosyltransferase
LLKIVGKRSLHNLERARKEWRKHARRHWRSRDRLPTTALSGALLMFRRDAFRAIGPFDDQFRLYFEENDWLFRVARAGLQSVYVPAAKAIHLHNPTLARAPERRQWEADSFLRFGNRYYGEHFMRRLLLACTRESVIPDWPFADAIRLDLSEKCVWPLWIELTPSPSGFPAATACITNPKSEWWQLPPMRGLEFLKGTFYLQVVDDVGQELCRYSFQRPTSQHPSVLTGRVAVGA